MGKIVNEAVLAAKEAGKFILANYGKIKRIEAKKDRDFATNVDKDAEKIIIGRVKSVFPGHGIIAEESGASSCGSDYLWIIDPLDGTHNFMRGIDIFGVSIGVVHKGNFVAGVIYMPLSDELYWAQTGSGSYKNGVRINVSKKSILKECSISFDSSIRRAPGSMLPVLKDLAENVFNVRMLGSSVRQLSYVAEGKLDFAVEFYDLPWDFAGGACLIQEAGGKITDLHGNPLTHKSTGYIASNSKIYNKVFRLVSGNL